jgi:hypothetical protein
LTLQLVFLSLFQFSPPNDYCTNIPSHLSPPLMSARGMISWHDIPPSDLSCDLTAGLALGQTQGKFQPIPSMYLSYLLYSLSSSTPLHCQWMLLDSSLAPVEVT